MKFLFVAIMLTKPIIDVFFLAFYKAYQFPKSMLFINLLLDTYVVVVSGLQVYGKIRKEDMAKE